MNVVDRDGGAPRAQCRDGDIAQPDSVFDQRAGTVVLAQQLAGFVVGVEDSAVDAAADLNPLAEGVVDRNLSGGPAIECLESSGVVVGGADGGMAGRVAGGVVGIRAGEGAGDASDLVGGGREGVGRGRGAGLGQAIAVGIVRPAAN